MSSPPILSSWRDTVTGIFPWLARVGLSETTGALEVRSARGLLELEGGGPAVGRVGDLVVRLCLDGMGRLWCSNSAEAPYSWALVAVGSTPVTLVPTISDAGTRVAIAAGSEKVTCG